MKKKPSAFLTERASLLNASAKAHGVFSVVAASEPALDRKLALASFECAHCQTVFAAHKGSQPFCVNCGSDDVDDTEEKLDIEPVSEDDSELSAVQCPSCSNHNIISDVTASTLGGKMFCVQCGEDIPFEVPEGQDKDNDFHDNSDEAEIEKKEDVAEDNPIDQPIEADAEGDDGDGFVDEPEDVTETEDIEDPSDEEAAGKRCTMAEDLVDIPEDPSDEDRNVGGDDMVVEESEVDDDNALERVNNPIDPGQAGPVDPIEMSMFDVMAGKGDFSLAKLEDAILAFVADVPVARLTVANAGDNADVFHTRAFAEAIAHTVADKGVEAALAHFGFEHITVAFPMGKAVNDRVHAALANRTKEVTAKLDTLTATFMQCMSIAATGLNKNFFKGAAHPLKAALFEEMSNAGFRNPSRLIDKVFASAGNAFNKEVLEKAMELMEKSAEFRNELAEAVGDSNYQPADEEPSEAEDLEEGCDDAGKMLEKSHLIPVKETASVRKGKVETASVHDVRQKLGGSLFRK